MKYSLMMLWNKHIQRQRIGLEFIIQFEFLLLLDFLYHFLQFLLMNSFLRSLPEFRFLRNSHLLQGLGNPEMLIVLFVNRQQFLHLHIIKRQIFNFLKLIFLPKISLDHLLIDFPSSLGDWFLL